MKIQQEISLNDFPFWSGAEYLAVRLTEDEFNSIENELEDVFEGTALMNTELNDMFWHEPGYICSLIGLDWENEVHKREEIK